MIHSVKKHVTRGWTQQNDPDGGTGRFWTEERAEPWRFFRTRSPALAAKSKK